MLWWLWVLLGLGLLGLEILTPGGFFVLFFGCGALAVGALVGAGLLQAAWAQWLTFSLLSVVSLLLFRGPLLRRIKEQGGLPPEVDSLVGETAVVMEEIQGGAIGKVELRGAAWSARNLEPSPLARGRRCRVEKVEGLMLSVRAESA
jgi:hypothetical protein